MWCCVLTYPRFDKHSWLLLPRHLSELWNIHRVWNMCRILKKVWNLNNFYYLCQLSVRVFGRWNGRGAGFALQFVFHVSPHSAMLRIHLSPRATTVDIVVIVAPVQGTQPHHTPWTKRKRKNLFWIVLIGLILLQYLRFVYSWLVIQQSINNTLCMLLHSFLIGSLS